MAANPILINLEEIQPPNYHVNVKDFSLSNTIAAQINSKYFFKMLSNK